MDVERVLAELGRESAEMITGLRDWRVAHPTATFAELEAVVDERLDVVRAGVLGDLAMASAAAGGAALAETERPTCPECGTTMDSRGQRTRHLTVPGNQTIPLTRRYWVCPACGAGLFPPG